MRSQYSFLFTILAALLCLSACATKKQIVVIEVTATPGATDTPMNINTNSDLPMTSGIYERYLPTSELTSYTLYLPDEYDPAVAYPLVVSLHYAGYDGPFFGRNLLEFAMVSGFQELNPIILAPDSPNWVSEAGEQTAVATTKFVLEHYKIDRKRVVLTGYSNGGGGTWLIASKHQDLYTAAMPMAALPLRNAAGIDWQIPILVMNSEADELFDFDSAERTASQLKELGANINFYAVENVSHYRADLYPGPIQDALPWLLAQWED